MFTALDADPKRLDQHEQTFVQRIREHGWVGTHVMPDDKGPGFSYTTGFWLKFSFPELILFSMSKENAQDTFWHIYRELEAGRRLSRWRADRCGIREWSGRAASSVARALPNSPRVGPMVLWQR
jgi:hypothetical protein